MKKNNLFSLIFAYFGLTSRFQTLQFHGLLNAIKVVSFFDI